MRLVVLALLALGGCAIGCSSAEAPAPFHSSGVSRAADDDDDDSEASGHRRPTPSKVCVVNCDPPVAGTSGGAPAASKVLAWHGRVDTSPMVDFGGGQWCNYHVVLSDLELHMTLDDAGHIASSDLTNTMTETATACDAEPLGVQANSYAFRKPTATTATTLTVMQTPDPNNLPQADVTLVAEAVDATHMRARLLFHRTGAVDNVLNWRDSIDVELTPEQ